MLKRLLALMMALCMLVTGMAFAEDEEISMSDMFIEVEAEEEAEEEDDGEVFFDDDTAELLDDLHLDVELDTSVDPSSLDLNPNLPDNVVNILLIGIDTRDTDLGEGLQQGDVQLILSLNKDDGSVKLTSILRDLYVTIPGYRNMNRINLSYSRGGGELAMRTVNKNFDMNIEYYATINFYGLASIIDAIGGIDIDMTKKEANAINTCLRKHPPKYDNTDGSARVPLEKIDGVQHLDGVQAVMYARVRSIDNDYSRTERQRKVLMSLIEEYKNQDLGTTMKMAEEFLPLVTTDIPQNQVMTYVMELFPMMSGAKVETLRIPVDGTFKGGYVRISGTNRKMWCQYDIDFGANREILQKIFDN